MDDIKMYLIEVAQELIQKHGYNGFSYRDIAAKVGIKSASIHYHFPTKADLGTAVAVNYKDRFMERLDAMDAAGADSNELLTCYASLFREALAEDNRMCLCGMLGAEVTSLPDAVANEVRRFFEANLDWLSGVFSRNSDTNKKRPIEKPEAEAQLMIASLEGALILAKGLGDPSIFDKTAAAALERYR